MYFCWKVAILIPYVIYDYQIHLITRKSEIWGFYQAFSKYFVWTNFRGLLVFLLFAWMYFRGFSEKLRENESPRKLISWRQLFCLNQWVWWNLILNTSQRKKILLFSKNFCSWLNFWHSSCWSTLFFSDVRYHKKNSLLFIFTPISFRSRFIKSVSGSFHLS